VAGQAAGGGVVGQLAGSVVCTGRRDRANREKRRGGCVRRLVMGLAAP
jgi:hypothetical protein